MHIMVSVLLNVLAHSCRPEWSEAESKDLRRKLPAMRRFFDALTLAQNDKVRWASLGLRNAEDCQVHIVYKMFGDMVYTLYTIICDRFFGM